MLKVLKLVVCLKEYCLETAGAWIVVSLDSFGHVPWFQCLSISGAIVFFVNES